MRIRSRFYVVFVCLAMALPAAAYLPTTERQLAFSADQDIEPTVMTQMRSGIEHQTAVWMNFATSSSPSRLKYNHYANGNATLGTLPFLAGYEGPYADPILAENESSAAPLQRMYLVGVTHTGAFTSPNAIVRWYSDDGGQTWSSAAAVVEYSGDLVSHFVDKPTVAVSPGGATGGYVYVLHTTMSNSSGFHQLMLSVSTNGGATWSGPHAVNSPTIERPIGHVVTDSNGDVYVVWAIRSDTGDYLRVSKSPAYNTATGMMNFGMPQSQLIGTLRQGGNQAIRCGSGCTIRAASVPIARIDTVRRRIGVTWHEENANGATVVRFMPINIALVNPQWLGGTHVPNSGLHHFQPTFDFDDGGNVLLTFYSMNVLSPYYVHRARYITWAGNTPMFDATLYSLSTNSNDITAYPPSSVGRLFGEYHDVHFSNGTFKTVGIQIRSGQGDPYLFTSSHYY